MKPIVIAGNGPSLAKIDYTRLPQDFDVFRCNQFYFEDRYFLGKKIKGVFFNLRVFQEQYFTLQELIERGEYETEEIYCRELHKEVIIDEDPFQYYFPHVKDTSYYLKQLPKFLELDRPFRLRSQWFTMGIVMLYTALAQGYKEIYLIGIDLYRGGGIDYAFDMKDKKNLCSKIPAFKNCKHLNTYHPEHLDIKAIRLAMQMKEVKIYCLSYETALIEFFSIAPVQNPNPMQVLAKPEGYICDFVESPECDSKENYGCNIESVVEDDNTIRKRLEELLDVSGIRKNNMFLKVLVDFAYCLRGVWRLLKKFIKR